MKQIKSLLSVFVLTLAATACAGNSGENKKSNEPTKEDNKMEVVALNKADFLKKYRIGVDLYHSRIFPYRRNTFFLLILPEKYLVANAVCYLQVDGLAFLKVHSYQRLMISDSLKRK